MQLTALLCVLLFYTCLLTRRDHSLLYIDPDLEDTGETEEQMSAREVVWISLVESVWNKGWKDYSKVGWMGGMHCMF